MRNLTAVVAWHRGYPKVSSSCIDPKGSTLSPENPRRWALTDSSFSLPMPILSKVDAKMMSTELSLLTSGSTLCIVLLATMAFITSGSSWGCWQPSKSESEKVMVVSNRGSLDSAYISSVYPDLMLRR